MLASAGVLWVVVLASSVVPAHYAVHWWRRDKKRTDESVAIRAEFERMAEAWGTRVTRWPLLARWFVAAPLTLVMGTALILAPLIFVITPMFPLMLLMAFGANLFDVLLPATGFHWVVLLTAVLLRWSGMDLAEHFDFRGSPHRVLTIITGVVLHAVLFGKILYPLIPPSGGGGRPLAVRIVA